MPYPIIDAQVKIERAEYGDNLKGMDNEIFVTVVKRVKNRLKNEFNDADALDIAIWVAMLLKHNEPIDLDDPPAFLYDEHVYWLRELQWLTK